MRHEQDTGSGEGPEAEVEPVARTAQRVGQRTPEGPVGGQQGHEEQGEGGAEQDAAQHAEHVGARADVQRPPRRARRIDDAARQGLERLKRGGRNVVHPRGLRTTRARKGQRPE